MADKGYKAYDPDKDYFQDEDESQGTAGKLRHAIRTRPLTSIGLAGAGGFAVGYMFGKSSTGAAPKP